MTTHRKRRNCGECGDSFSSPWSAKRHQSSCGTHSEETFPSESSDDEDIFMEEGDIEELIQSFRPSSFEGEASAPDITPFFQSIVTWTCLFICIWQSVYYVSSNAIGVLLQFVNGIMQVACQHYNILCPILPMIPSSIYMMRRYLNIHKNTFSHFVACTSCHSIYRYSDCVIRVEGVEVSKTCPFISQPNHPQRHHRKPCGAQLLQTFNLSSGKTKLLPYKNYYYKSLKETIHGFLGRPGFSGKCELWRDRRDDDSTMSDIYDGNIWKEFRPTFLSKKGNYGLMLNLDWFQPFEHVRYSVGVMYMVILNLPREERYKRENIIIVGVIPHMTKEPPTNTFVKPLVDEVIEAWNIGYEIGGETIRLALLCIGCDVPACRKLCGFLGHAAIKGCSRCKKSFPGEIGQRDYSGFNRLTWIPRTHDQHIRETRQISRSSTKGTKEQLERAYDNVECPSDVGRVPYKIASGFAGFTAVQFKNWTLLFSIFALKGILPDEHLECWRYFVLACRFLCCRILTQSDIVMADSLLMKFCASFEHLYGTDRVTPNMHLHGHLIECVRDFGPIYSFWLFSFERFYGMLGDFPTNKKHVELQMMKNFCNHTQILGLTVDDKYSFGATLNPLLQSMTTGNKAGTLGRSSSAAHLHIKTSSSRLTPLLSCDWTYDHSYSFNKFKIRGLTSFEENNLLKMNKKLYNSDIEVFPVAKKINTVYLGKEILGSANSSSGRSSMIVAYWTDNHGDINWDLSPRPGCVTSYILHTITVDNEERTHLLAEVKWFSELPENIKHHCGRPTELWSPDTYVPAGSSSFMPVQRIKTKFVKMNWQFGRKHVMCVSPRDRFLSC